MVTTATAYRAIGDVPIDTWRAELDRLGSPFTGEVATMHAAAQPHSALCLAMGIIENRWGATGIIIQPHHNNPLSLRPWAGDRSVPATPGMPAGATGVITASNGKQFLTFDAPASCIREWKRRLFDDRDYKAGIYRPAVTLAEMLAIYAPAGDVHPVTGVDNAAIDYAAKVAAIINRLTPGGDTMATHRYILSAGHRNENRGGARGEIDWTYGSTLALKAAIEARGGAAWIVQQEDGDGDDSFCRGRGLQDAARLCVDLARVVGGVDAYISSHYNGGASPGFHAIFPDSWGVGDRKADNPLDVRLCRRMRDAVKATNTVRMLSWTADSPGVMSERETGVGAKGYRLGEFVGTLGFRDTTARVIIEASSIDTGDRQYIQNPDWVRHVYAEAIVDALEAEFGAFPGTATPEPEKPETVYAPAATAPWADDLRSGKAASVVLPSGETWFAVDRWYRAKAETSRRQYAADGSKPIGPPIPAGTRFLVDAVGTTQDGAYALTPWDTRVDLDDLELDNGSEQNDLEAA